LAVKTLNGLLLTWSTALSIDRKLASKSGLYQIVERERYTAERRLASKEGVMAHAGGRPLTVDWHEDADTVRQA
jgi:hypothetical protein